MLFLVIVGGLSYFAYNKYFNSSSTVTENSAEIENIQPVQKTDNSDSQNAMPNETLETVTKETTEEGNSAVSIPAIEQNIDASVLVANLAVNWEVPSAYVSNANAKRYFTKIGKVLRLNLKTELLLQNKPPISDKVVVALQYNKNRQQFEIKEMTTSSGQEGIDKIITNTINKVLGMSFSTNMSVFNNLSGNPVLIIHF